MAFIPGVVGAIFYALGDYKLGELTMLIAASLILISIAASKLPARRKAISSVLLFVTAMVLLWRLDQDRQGLTREADAERLRMPYGSLTSENKRYDGPETCSAEIQFSRPYALHLDTVTVRAALLPHAVVMKGGQVILEMDRSENGDLTLTLDVSDRSGMILAEIKNGTYKISTLEQIRFIPAHILQR